MMAVADPDAVHAVRTFIKKQIALSLKEDLLATVSFAIHVVHFITDILDTHDQFTFYFSGFRCYTPCILHVRNFLSSSMIDV